MLIDKLITKNVIDSNDILMDSQPLLRKKCTQIDIPIDNKIAILGEKMLEHVQISQDEKRNEQLKLRSAVGIAAPQLGLPIQMIAIHIADEQTPLSVIMVNPKIIAHSERLCALKNGEACLSVAEGAHEGIVHRFQKIKVKAFSLLENKEKIFSFTGYESIVVQHELDHLKGVLYYDHINSKDIWHIKEKTIII